MGKRALLRVLSVDTAFFEVLLDRFTKIPDTASPLRVSDLVLVTQVLELAVGETVALLNVVSV